MRYRFIREQQAQYSVSLLCQAMKVSRSGFYDWRDRGPSARAREDERLGRLLVKLHERHRQTYGTLRLHQELKARGESCSKHRVARLKRTLGLWTKRRKRFVRTSKSDFGQRFRNVLNRGFAVKKANRVWASDVTAISTLQGWLYLAIVLDLYSRRVVGWSMADSNSQQLTIDALQMALQLRQPRPGLLHHSDRGCNYTSNGYQQLLRQWRIRPSMSRAANCHDNAVAESFFSTLKNELICRRRFKTREEAKGSIFDYIEVFYNRERRHSYLKGMSPCQYEERGKVSI